MQKLYQTEWFGIPFKEFIKFDNKKIANTDFYNAFYTELFQKYNSYSEFPEDWKKEKESVAKHLLTLTSNNASLLSIGCGNGYIEDWLSRHHRIIHAIEPSEKALALLKKNNSIKIFTGYFPQCLENDKIDYDLIYSTAIEYVMSNKQLLQFLRNVKGFKPKRFILFSASVYKPQFDYRHTIRKIMKNIKAKIFRSNNSEQLWGYCRTTIELKKCFEKAAFTNIEIGFVGKNHFWIKGL